MKQTTTYGKGRRGWFAVETLVSIALLTVLAAMATTAMTNYSRVRDRYVWQQAARWAASAQLQRIQAGAAWDTMPADGTVPEEVHLETIHRPGKGAWEGCELVTVTATVEMSRGQPIRELVHGYVGRRDQP